MGAAAAAHRVTTERVDHARSGESAQAIECQSGCAVVGQFQAAHRVVGNVGGSRGEVVNAVDFKGRTGIVGQRDRAGGGQAADGVACNIADGRQAGRHTDAMKALVVLVPPVTPLMLMAVMVLPCTLEAVMLPMFR